MRVISPSIKPPHVTEDGAVAVIIVGLALLLSGVLLLVIYGGVRQVSGERLQNAAESLALGAAAAVREHGPLETMRQFDTLRRQVASQYRVARLAADLRILRLGVDPQYPERRYVQVTAHLDSSVGPWARGARDVRQVVAYAYVGERVFGEVWKPVIFAVDHGEMAKLPVRSAGPQIENVWQLSTALLSAHLSRPLPARNGLIVFSGNHFTGFNAITEQAFVPLPEANLPHDGQRLRFRAAFKRVDDPSERMTANASNAVEALRRAQKMLSQSRSDHALVVLLSPGLINAGNIFEVISPLIGDVGDYLFAEADRLREEGVAVASLHLLPDPRGWDDWSQFNYAVGKWAAGFLGQRFPNQLMRGVAGGPPSQGNDPRFYMLFEDDFRLERLLAALRYFVCRWQMPAIPQGDFLFEAFMRDVIQGDEQAFRYHHNPYNLPPGPYYGVEEAGPYLPGSYLILGEEGCAALGERPHVELLVRYGAATLCRGPDAK